MAKQPSNNPLLRVKTNFSASKRRISCQDLGHGDCEGWLWKKKEKPGILSKGWKKRFFKLKDKILYFYKDKNDLVADGMLSMPAFKISPCVEKESTRKFSFKLCHSSCGTFYLASEGNSDMNKWIKILQLATLENNNCLISKTDSGTVTADDCSESESSDIEMESENEGKPKEEDTTSTTAVQELCTGLNGFRMSSIKRTLSKERSVGRPEDACSKLARLRRTLKAKEEELNEIVEFLNMSPITSSSLHNFNLKRLEDMPPS